MQNHSIFNNIKPYLSASFALSALTLLVAAIYFPSEITKSWVTGLWGALFITIFIMIGQIFFAARQNSTITTQLFTTKERLSNEIKHRLWAEKTISENKIESQLIDESLPVLLAYFTVSQRCRYHNRAYRNWLGLNATDINDQFLQEFSSEEFYLSLKDNMKAILAGETIFNECPRKSAQGTTYNLYEQFIPHFDSKKKVIGFYTLYIPHIPEKSQNTTSNSNEQNNSKYDTITETLKQSEQNPELTVSRIVQAIDNDEFNLYFQKIISLKTNTGVQDQYEILIRMTEEESNLLPPGAFLPIVEKFKMMPRLDRWVVTYMTNWLSSQHLFPETKFCINIAKDTLSRNDFPVFVKHQLEKSKAPAHALCFEIEESDALEKTNEAANFATRIKQLGCFVSLCGINHNQDSVNLLKKIKPDLVKINGSLVYNIQYSERDLAKVAALHKIAHKIKAKTIAELVETDELIVKLRQIGVDFAQGFGVAKPRPLTDIKKS